MKRWQRLVRNHRSKGRHLTAKKGAMNSLPRSRDWPCVRGSFTLGPIAPKVCTLG